MSESEISAIFTAPPGRLLTDAVVNLDHERLAVLGVAAHGHHPRLQTLCVAADFRRGAFVVRPFTEKAVQHIEAKQFGIGDIYIMPDAGCHMIIVIESNGW